ncbi:hypothetical protein LAZ67_8000436 [Cordylochernes scorpioides]|uniref:Uncharacterized protein n=1 Tax=Cordylochernes scorpioides TaxID=51811 RepID=A0ABY6KR17_9ARAC|nr:hypothetical protein LAZ67_8000436 [Cordylochernes scorpioides]
MLEMTRTDPEWKDKIITGDETWVYDPETKRQSAEWRGQASVPLTNLSCVLTPVITTANSPQSNPNFQLTAPSLSQLPQSKQRIGKILHRKRVDRIKYGRTSNRRGRTYPPHRKGKKIERPSERHSTPGDVNAEALVELIAVLANLRSSPQRVDRAEIHFEPYEGTALEPAALAEVDSHPGGHAELFEDQGHELKLSVVPDEEYDVIRIGNHASAAQDPIEVA